MRIRVVPVLAVLSLGAVTAGTAGCNSMASAWNWCCQKGDLITYEKFAEIDTDANPPLTVNQVMEKLGTPMEIHEWNGARRQIDYRSYSVDDSIKRAEFKFDKEEKLTDKILW